MVSSTEQRRGIGDADVGDSLAIAALSLARRFAEGATLWCIAPDWPAHARHVAVEFVHPVLVGKRALPAVSIEAPDPAVELRALVRASDVVLAVSRFDSPSTLAVMRRCEAWGATTVWIGAGRRPETSAADHILWHGGDDDDTGSAISHAAYDGRMALIYHVLWELTHVCFEHPGLLAAPEARDVADECITCSDEGRVGEVISADSLGSARVRTARGIETIDATIVDTLARGDLVLIHAGTAITVVP